MFNFSLDLIFKLIADLMLIIIFFLEQTTVSLPSHWEDMKGKLVLCVKLQQGSQEYANVEKKFRKTGLTSNILQVSHFPEE